MNTEQQENHDGLDEDFALGDRLIDNVIEAIEQRDSVRLTQLLEPLHSADIADILEQISAGQRRALLRLWKGEMEGEVLSELDESLREEVMESLAPEELAEAVRDLETDDVVDLLEDLDAPQQDEILEVLEDADRVAVEQALTYPEDSAGRLMQRELVVAPEHWTVGQAIDYLRSQQDLPEQFYHMILVDPKMRPTGYVTLGKLLSSPRDAKMQDIVEDSFRTISVNQDEEDVAYAFNQYHLISAPVVDDDGRLVGVITIDDAMAVLDEEHEEDMLRLAGVGEGSLSDRVIETSKRRLPWLFVTMFAAIAASFVIAQFEDTIAEFVALAILMPIVASMGGNAGTQALTVAVRALATKDITSANVWRVIRREVLVGMVNGVVFALVMGVIGMLWFGMPMLGVVIGAALVINLLVASLAGVVVPVVLDKLGIDPALASGAFVTTVTDVVGFFAFLGLASVVLL
ncbi:magnesium transporter [Profundibacter amoris]|uniref:Magnesium transporter MgtE n=1 Tax=Profundibacter amoris TaxID=2171755 RepID=A0A347UHY0_9RHOB|nr:magnesium transporter [Profundibacter amoris]AXX98458.1 magnesium transporter [Profundibacter amoris]